jgi:uncharacterized protein YjdB
MGSGSELTIQIMRRRFGVLLVASLGSLTCSKDAAGPILAQRVAITGPDTVYLGDSAQFRALALDAGGSMLPSRPITWSSSDTTIASVNGAGLVRTRSLGAATIQATADGATGGRPLSVVLIPVYRVNVTPNIDSLFVGDSIQFSATVSALSGRILTDRPVTWVSSDTMKATVSTIGLVRTRAPGSFAITARADTVTAGVFLYAQLRVAALLMPDSFSIGLRQSVRLIPDLQSESGTHLSGRPIVWGSSDPSVLEVAGGGVLQLHRVGSATIVARFEGLADSSFVQVVPEPIAYFTMSFISSGPFADTTVEALEATPYDAFNFPTDVDSITWTSSDTTVLRIAPSPSHPRRALLTGLRSGIAILTATSGSAQGSLTHTLTYPMVRFVAQPDSITVGIGQAVPVGGFGLDRFGNRVSASGPPVVSAADTTVAVVSTDGGLYVSAVRPGRTAVYVRYASGPADTVPIIVLPRSIPRLSWTTGPVSQYSYSIAGSRLIVVDSNGTELDEPRDIRITSSDTTIAVVTPSSIVAAVQPIDITIETRKPGTTVVTAGTDSQFTNLYVTVYNQPAISVELDPTPPALQKGASLQLSAVARRFDGVPRPYPITWTTSNPGVATVSTSGVVNAVTEGLVSIRASSDTASDVAEFTVVSSNPPIVSAIAPTPLVPGASVTITGTGFDPDASANSVFIDGVAATVATATPTELVVNLPPAHDWPCAFDHDVHLVITSGGRVGLDSAQLHVATPRGALTPGDTIGLDGEEARCNELAPVGGNAWYVVLAANTDVGNPLSLGFAGNARAVPPGPAPAAEPRSAPTPSGISLAFSLDSLRRSALTHRRLLEQSRALSRRAGPPAPLLRAARRLEPQHSVAATINGLARVRIPKLEDPDFCSSYRTITARVVFTGAHVVILEDNAAPLAGTMDYQYALLGQEFDGAMYPKLLANFGNPLAMDSLLDRDGRIAMVFSPVVNSYGIGGFVVSCDFYPESVAPSSNTGEIFYAHVPLTPGGGFNGFSGEVWRWLTRSIAMHEAKHITAFAERLSRGAPIDDTWLEEASAVLAEELWTRNIYFTTWKGDASYRSTIYCDVRPTWPECAGRPYSMFNAFAFLYDYVTQLDRRTPLGPTSYDDATFYGSGWSFLRWAVDQSNTTESDFLKQLVQEPALTGVANLEARAQRPFSEMLPEWADALYHDSWALPPTRPTWSMPSWKLDDIFAGMRQDFPSDFPDAYPVRGREWTLGSPFEWKPVTLAPGGWALLTGNGIPHDAPQLVKILSGGDGPLPPSLHVQIIRVR